MCKLRKYIVAWLLVGPINAFADCIPDHCASVYVDTLYAESTGGVYVGTSGDESVLNCHAVANVYVTLPGDMAGADTVYSTLLSAQVSGKRVTIQVDDNSTGCVIQYVTLSRQ